jgi:GNAT superfamily N-acetyltransferase
MNIEITDSPKKEDDDYIISNVQKYNRQFVDNDGEPLSVYFKNTKGEIIAGLTGKTFWKWLHIEFLWVQETERGKKLGSQLILSAEKEAVSRGCVGSTLDTFSFQALDFYKKVGYSLIGSLSGYADKYQRHYLEKKID